MKFDSRKGLLAALVYCAANAATADPHGWGALTAENNNIGDNQDRYYVNGFNFAYLSPSTAQDRGWMGRATDAVEDTLPLFAAAGATDRRFEWTALGQQIFTPADKSLTVPDPHDRPYAAWLYGGLSFLQDSDARRLDDLDFTLGLVGPHALGRQTQNGFHKLFGFGSSNGWSHQLRDEPGLTLAYARKWRWAFDLASEGGLQADLIPELGATLGNVLDAAEAALTARIGWGLDADYGPRMIQPGFSGGAYFNPERTGRRWGLNLFAGFQQRLVGRNLFLDGNSFRTSPSVPKYPLVHDLTFGLSGYGSRSLRVDLAYIMRSDEFHGQLSPEHYGSITLAVRW